jgi:hypothetical protein
MSLVRSAVSIVCVLDWPKAIQAGNHMNQVTGKACSDLVMADLSKSGAVHAGIRVHKFPDRSLQGTATRPKPSAKSMDKVVCQLADEK